MVIAVRRLRRPVIAASLLLAGFLASCSPPARSTGYFESHPDEAVNVDVDCRTGANRGPECESSSAALIKRKATETQAEASKMTERTNRVSRKW